MIKNAKLHSALLLVLATACGGGKTTSPSDTPDPQDTQEKTPELPVTPEPIIPVIPIDPATQADVTARAPSTASNDPSNTFEHTDLAIDPLEVLGRMSEEGTPATSARLHSCQKPKYTTIRNILTSLGVDIGRDANPPSAGQLYRMSEQVLGGPNYAARVREAQQWTTAGATRLFDIFVQAAPEIIAAMPNNDHCKIAGQPTRMFDDAGGCTIAGISCLQGARATQTQKDLCDAAIADASSPEKGQAIAVAVILSAAHTCE